MASGLSLGASVSLLHNNLAITPSWFAAVHNASTAAAGGGKTLSGKVLLHSVSDGMLKEVPSNTTITSARFLELATGYALCVTSHSGTVIYSEDAAMVLFCLYLDMSEGVERAVQFHNASCVIPEMQHIVIGTSQGSLVPIVAVPDNYAPLPEATPNPAASEVADVCFLAATSQLASAHSSGEVRIWSVVDLPYSNVLVIPPVGQAPVRIATIGGRLLVAFGTGTICLFDGCMFNLQVEITAHARWITAVAVREETGQIATVGEDTVLNVWNIAPSGEVSLLHSSVVAPSLLTGAGFYADGILATAYDSDQLYNVPIPPLPQ